jgi:hypothetical protein
MNAKRVNIFCRYQQKNITSQNSSNRIPTSELTAEVREVILLLCGIKGTLSNRCFKLNVVG